MRPTRCSWAGPGLVGRQAERDSFAVRRRELIESGKRILAFVSQLREASAHRARWSLQLCRGLGGRGYDDRPVGRLRDADRVPKRIAQRAVGPIEALDGLLNELDAGGP